MTITPENRLSKGVSVEIVTPTLYIVEGDCNGATHAEAIRRLVAASWQYAQILPIAIAHEVDHQTNLPHDAIDAIGEVHWENMDRISKALKSFSGPYHTSNRYRPSWKNRQIRRWLSGGKFPSRNWVKVRR